MEIMGLFCACRRGGENILNAFHSAMQINILYVLPNVRLLFDCRRTTLQLIHFLFHLFLLPLCLERQGSLMVKSANPGREYSLCHIFAVETSLFTNVPTTPVHFSNSEVVVNFNFLRSYRPHFRVIFNHFLVLRLMMY